MWTLAILYSVKYKQLCEHLVGGYIDRVPSNEIVNLGSFQKIWPDYDNFFFELDREHTVWILNKDIVAVLNNAFDKVRNTCIVGRTQIKSTSLNSEIGKIRAEIEGKYLKVSLNRPDSEILISHESYNEKTFGSPSEIYENVLGKLPSNLLEIIQSKLCIGHLAQIYLQEYARFMTLIYFSLDLLTPSEEVDQVWHIHQSLTVEYRNFCIDIYGKFIHHSPTVGGLADNEKYTKIYTATLQFYLFIFKENPPIGIWPCPKDRFNSQNFIGSWYSLLRIYQCIIRVLEMHKTTRPTDVPTEIMACYFMWTGRNLFKTSSYTVVLHKEYSTRPGLTTSDYWYAGGCAIIIPSGCGGDSENN